MNRKSEVMKKIIQFYENQNEIDRIFEDDPDACDAAHNALENQLYLALLEIFSSGEEKNRDRYIESERARIINEKMNRLLESCGSGYTSGCGALNQYNNAIDYLKEYKNWLNGDVSFGYNPYQE